MVAPATAERPRKRRFDFPLSDGRYHPRLLTAWWVAWTRAALSISLYQWGVGLTAGGGLDYETPLLHHHIAIRLFQADYEYMHVNSGPSHFSGSEFVWGGRENIDAARLSAGVVLHVGSIVPPPPVTPGLRGESGPGLPGDPLTITATPGNLNPKKTPVYTWTGDGVTGNGTTATVATASLAPGTYTVKGSVKEGNKPGQSAECSATYTVKAFEPPTVSCSASPSTIKPGESSNHYRCRREPAEPPPDLCLLGSGRHGNRQWRHRDLCLHRRTDRTGRGHLHRLGRQGTDRFFERNRNHLGTVQGSDSSDLVSLLDHL